MRYGVIHLVQNNDEWMSVENRWNFKFYKILGYSWVAKRLAASQEGPSSMELVSIIQNYDTWNYELIWMRYQSNKIHPTM
jgi:hypothetical protein